MSDITSLASVTDAPSQPEATHRYREASRVTTSERQAIDPREIITPNVDVLGAVSTANTAMPAVRALREQIVKILPTYDLTLYDRLQTYTWALQFAQVLYVAATRPAEPVQEMAARAARLREVLVSDISALVKRGVMDGERLKQLRGGVAYRNIAFDLQVLAAMLREHWEVIASRTMITEDEIAEAEALGDDLTDTVDGRERPSAVSLKATSDRARAFTLFYRSYDEARRLAVFVRWHENDADELVPSLYAGRGGRGKSETTDDRAPAPVAGGAPVAPVAGGAPVAPVAGGVQPVAPVIPGQPGGSPFLR